MAAVLDPVVGTDDAPRRVRFTRPEVDRLMDLGAFQGRRFELIDGDLIDKMGQKPPHAYALTLLMRYLVRLFGIDRLRCQLPIEVAQVDREYSYPEPDLVVTRTADDGYAHRHPNGTEISLLAEVADTSSHFDRTVKAELYARAGVPEYWVLDVGRRHLYIHRRPLNGHYSQTLKLSDSEAFAPEGQPVPVASVASLLP